MSVDSRPPVNIGPIDTMPAFLHDYRPINFTSLFCAFVIGLLIWALKKGPPNDLEDDAQP
jgi:hypothetical protein